MAEYHELYRRATYYDLIFDRDVSHEVEFIRTLSERLTGRVPAKVLEVASGPGYHAREFARRGACAYALDIRPEMVDLACRKAEQAGVMIHPVVADMRAFDLPDRVDCAFTMFDGLDCLLTNAEVVAHLRTVARNLTLGGLYVLEFTHPRDSSPWSYGTFQYSGERDGCRATIDWAVNAPVADLLTQIFEVDVVMRVYEADGSIHEFHDRARERCFGPQELVALGDLSGALRVVEWYGDFRLDQPFDNSPGARRMIAVLQRTPDTQQSHSSYVSSKLQLRASPTHGFGLFARESVDVGDVIVVWAGRVMATNELVKLDGARQGRALQVEEDLHLLAEPEPADYVNHSCDPNAGLSGQVALVALRAIEPGEEIRYDYGMSEGLPDAFQSFECRCGAPGCRRRITGDDWRRGELQDRYAGFFSPYLQRRLARSRTSRST